MIRYTDGYADQHTASINILMSLNSAEIGMTSNGLRLILIKYYFLKSTLFYFMVKLTLENSVQHFTLYTTTICSTSLSLHTLP